MQKSQRLQIVEQLSEFLHLPPDSALRRMEVSDGERIEAMIVTTYMVMKGYNDRELDQKLLPELHDYILFGTDLLENDVLQYAKLDLAMPDFLKERLRLYDGELVKLFKSKGQYMAPQVVYRLYVNPLFQGEKEFDEMLDEEEHFPLLVMAFQHFIFAQREALAGLPPVVESALWK